MKTILTVAIAASLIASAGAASAQPSQYRGGQDGRFEQSQRYDRYDNRGRYGQRATRRYNAGRYQRPAGYQQRHWTQGQRLPASYRGRAYVVDHSRYGLRAPPRGYQYTRVDNDVVLTAVATGLIASVIVGLFQ